MTLAKSRSELQLMAKGGATTARVIEEVLGQAVPGISTWELDQLAERRIVGLGATPGFKKVHGYRFATCINLNDEIVHGLPSREKIIRAGDIVTVDAGAFYGGFHTDAAWTIAVPSREGKISGEVKDFLAAGAEALAAAVQVDCEGHSVGDISAAIQSVIEESGYNVVRDLIGHGVGRELHEEPQIPCFGRAGSGEKLRSGMTLAIEVLYVMGRPEIEILEDGWTIRTRDGSLAAVFEETVGVGEFAPQVLTPIGLQCYH